MRVEARSASMQEILKIHSEAHYDGMEQTQHKSPDELVNMAYSYNSIYLHKLTFPCALLAAGSVVEMTERVLQGQLRSGVAVVRPPGHHAVTDKCMGFCIFNSVAIAARVAIDNYSLSRVLIVDWDVHHGNATQEQFYNDKRVLYFSLHRYDNGMFYPNSIKADSTYVGGASAKGYNVNVAWSGSRMGDAEYLAAFQHILLPIAYEFNPELVLVSSGLDAAQGDPLGRYLITPAGYAHMTHLLRGLAGGKMVLALEGGYNLTSIANSTAACVEVLLGDPLPPLEGNMVPNDDAVVCISNTVSVHVPYWESLKLLGGTGKTAVTSTNYDTSSPDFEPFEKQPKSHDKPPESGDQSHDKPPESHDQAKDGAEGGSEASKESQDRWLGHLREQSAGQEMMFAVCPMPYCDHLSSLSPSPLPPDIASRRCEECDEVREPWVCLQCHHVYCGRYINGHMVAHTEDSGHPLTISLADISVWCFPCDAYLDHASLRPAKNVVHRGKFGCNMDGSTE